MKTTKKAVRYMEEPSEKSSVVQEIATLPGWGEVISVRAAKAHLSGLLDWVAAGREVVVTSGGEPKARITPLRPTRPRKVFLGSAAHLQTMPKWKGGPTSEELVREDRDGRG